MPNIYAENPKPRGHCDICKKKGPEWENGRGRKKHLKYIKYQYWMVFRKVNWFRGDDQCLGKICTKCKKAGALRSFEENTFEEQQKALDAFKANSQEALNG